MSPNDAATLEVSRRDLESYVARLLAARGLGGRPGARTAAALVIAELWGVRSHGLLRLPFYLDRLAAGGINPGASLGPVRDTGPLVTFDGQAGMGHWQFWEAADLSVARAQAHGVGIVTVGNSNHCGALGVYALPAAAAGLVTLLMSNGPAVMPAWGGSSPVLSTSPIAASLPTIPVPTILDLSLSQTSRGRVFERSGRGEPLEPGWAFDADGEPTVDASQALAGMLAPLGGVKGYALALMVEVFTGGCVGPRLSSDVADMFDLDRADTPQATAHTVLAVDPGMLSVDPDWRDRLATLARQVDDSGGRVPGRDRVELANATGARVEVPESMRQRLLACSAELDVEPPGGLA